MNHCASLVHRTPATTEHRNLAGWPSEHALHGITDVEACNTETVPAPAQRGVVQTALPMRHAGVQTLRIAYECIGRADAPVLFVAGGISANRHVLASERYPEPGWWQTQNGHGLDARRWRIVAIDWLGADGRLDAPIDSADQADAITHVLDALGIDTLHAFIGCSYGAMVGLQFAARHASRLGRLIAISGTHRAHPYASAWRALQRRIVALGQLQCDESHGLSLARQLAMLSYRTPQEFSQRFASVPTLSQNNSLRSPADDYLEHCGTTYAARTPATAFLRLSESIDLHRVEPAEIAVPTTVVAVFEDRLVPVEDAFDLAERLPKGNIKLLRSIYGHDAFLKEAKAIADILDGVLPKAVAA